MGGRTTSRRVTCLVHPSTRVVRITPYGSRLRTTPSGASVSWSLARIPYWYVAGLLEGDVEFATIACFMASFFTSLLKKSFGTFLIPCLILRYLIKQTVSDSCPGEQRSGQGRPVDVSPGV